MTPLYDRFLPLLPAGRRILDAGCGVGRNALAFAERGYSVVAFVGLARARVGARAEILQMTFSDVTWHRDFDGRSCPSKWCRSGWLLGLRTTR
jgi:hypothetical protein